ncbi:MAG: hypothetical protein M3P11_00245 [Actinomycetota bacterium]|nr:hypothetical protein [Actinomycetota bacterium]
MLRSESFAGTGGRALFHAIYTNIVVQLVFYLGLIGAIGVAPVVIWLLVVERPGADLPP